MSRLGFVARRFARLVVTVWAVFTLAFAYVAVTPYTGGALAGEGLPASPSDPLVGKYVAWLGWFLTVWDEAVVGRVLARLPFTAAYLVPALAFAVVAGTAVRIYTVAREGSRVDSLVSAVTIVAVSVPVFLVALSLRNLFIVPYIEFSGNVRIYDPTLGAFAGRNLLAAAWPAAAMGVYLLAVQLRYAGDVLQEYANAEFVRTARAKGVSTWRIGRHVFRNTAIPLLTVFFTDMLGMVVVGVFVVEYVVYTPGVGRLLIEAALRSDLPLILVLSVGTVLLGVFANFLQDVAYLLFDPRVSFED